MGFLFLDIETYSSKNNPDSSLNPYGPESKILVMSYNYSHLSEYPQLVAIG